MSAQAPFLGNACSQTLYTLDVARRFVNVGGVAHRAVRREHLKQALAKTDKAVSPVRHAALRGGLVARDLFSVVSVPYDFVVGTGRHRLVPGENRAHDSLLGRPVPASRPPRTTSMGRMADVLANPLSRLYSTWKHHQGVGHSQRVKYLANRFRQTLDNPCDMGLLGTAGLWATLPVYAAASIVGAGIGCIGATVSYGVLTLADKRPTSFTAFTARWAAFVGASAATVMFGALMTAPAWVGLQGLRVLGAAAKGAVTAVGAGVGALVGLCSTATHPATVVQVPPLAHLKQE